MCFQFGVTTSMCWCFLGVNLGKDSGSRGLALMDRRHVSMSLLREFTASLYWSFFGANLLPLFSDEMEVKATNHRKHRVLDTQWWYQSEPRGINSRPLCAVRSWIHQAFYPSIHFLIPAYPAHSDWSLSQLGLCDGEVQTWTCQQFIAGLIHRDKHTVKQIYGRVRVSK